MNYRYCIVLIVTLLVSTIVYGQSHIEKCFEGGEKAFSRHIQLNISYPKEARENGIIGLSSFSFTIDCEQKPTDFQFEHTVGYGIEDAIMRVIGSTKGKWCNCRDIENQRISLTIRFNGMNSGSYTPKADFVIGASISNTIVSDGELMAKADKMIKKEKYDKALIYLNMLLFRYPNNEEYKEKYNTVYQQSDEE